MCECMRGSEYVSGVSECMSGVSECKCECDCASVCEWECASV